MLAQVSALWPWEALAVALGLAYLVLAIRGHPACWPAGIASSAIYLALFNRQSLYMEAVLQLFYIAISLYGWRHWLGRPASATANVPRTRRASATPSITSWRVRDHAAALGLTGVVAAVNGAALAAFTSAALPWLDALVAWGSVVATWMVARKILENWLYWFVIDALCVYIYARRGLWLTAGLFVVYLAMIVVGYRSWRMKMQHHGEVFAA